MPSLGMKIKEVIDDKLDRCPRTALEPVQCSHHFLCDTEFRRTIALFIRISHSPPGTNFSAVIVQPPPSKRIEREQVPLANSDIIAEEGGGPARHKPQLTGPAADRSEFPQRCTWIPKIEVSREKGKTNPKASRLPVFSL